MSYAEIHLKSGSVVRFEATELTYKTIPGRLIEIGWKQPEGARSTPMIITDQVAAALFVEGPLPL